MLREKNEVVEYEVTVDEKKGKVLVSVTLQPRRGRETTQNVGSSEVRAELDSRGIEAGVMISGNAIHNNMSRALGLRTEADLRSNFIFALSAEDAEVVEAAVEAVEVKEEVEVEAVVATEPVEEEVVVKKSTPRRRSRSKK